MLYQLYVVSAFTNYLNGLSYSDCLLAMTQRVHEKEETIIGEELGAHPMEREDDITPATKPVNAVSSASINIFLYSIRHTLVTQQDVLSLHDVYFTAPRISA